jgi:hypothetical protein
MKLNWGNKIAIAYSAFVLFIIAMVYMSFGEKYDLVTEDYYAQELAYQAKIDAKNRLEGLEENLKVSLEAKNLLIEFPHHDSTLINGKVNCFRPSDQGQDFTVLIENKQKVVSIPVNQFISGKYLLKLDWTANEKSFYTEQTVIIP